MRVHELAKKLKITSKELIDELKKHGVKAKNHMELLDAKVTESILKKSRAAKSEPKTVQGSAKKEKALPKLKKDPH